MGADWQQDIQASEQTGSKIFRHASTLAAGYSGTRARCLQIFRHASTLPADIQAREHTACRYLGMRADWQQDNQASKQDDSRILRHASRLAEGY
jgi:hypothetical protein